MRHFSTLTTRTGGNMVARQRRAVQSCAGPIAPGRRSYNIIFHLLGVRPFYDFSGRYACHPCKIRNDPYIYPLQCLKDHEINQTLLSCCSNSSSHRGPAIKKAAGRMALRSFKPLRPRPQISASSRSSLIATSAPSPSV